MDNAAVPDRYRHQAEARLNMAGLLVSDDPAVQFNDRGDRHITRACIGMLLWSAAVDVASVLFIQETRTQPNGRSPQITRFVTKDMNTIRPGLAYDWLWRTVTKLHTAQRTADTDPRQLGEDCNASSETFAVLNWLNSPAGGSQRRRTGGYGASGRTRFRSETRRRRE